MSVLRSFFFLPFLLLGFSRGFAQYSEYELKTVFIYKFAESLQWTSLKDSESFKVAVMKTDRNMYRAFEENFADKTINGLPISVIRVGFSELDTLQAHILFISEIYNSRLPDIINMTKGRNILRVTDEVPKKEQIMINFIEDQGALNFEINPLAITDADIGISQKLLLLGGNEIDVVNINQDLQEKLDREKARVEAQTRMIARQKNSLDEQLRVIGYQSDRIDRQRQTIENQEQYLEETLARIEEGREKLEKQDLLLMQGQDALYLSKNRTEAIRRDAEEFREEIRKSQKTLHELEGSIKQNRNIINSQRQSLEIQGNTIKKQRVFFYLSFGTAVFLALIAYFIYRNYRLKNRVNKVLSEKNEEITIQKSQLEEQTRILDAANKRLKESHEEINAGIRYAMTIQSAVLPCVSSISDHFESFVLYRPKDYVSGDFFWAKSVRKLGRDFFFAAVVDCTGHGVSGAFMSFVGNRILNEIIVNEKQINPVRILKQMHLRVSEIFEENVSGNRDGMVLSLIRIESIDDNSYNVLVSGAKQAVFIKDSRSEDILRVRGDIKEIGSPHYDMVDFSSKSFVLHKKSIIYMMSDGFIDQNNPQRKKLGTQYLRTLLAEATELPIEEQHSFFASELDSFQEGAEQRDDITLMGLRL